MKKIISVLLALLCVISIAGCKPNYPYEAEYTELGIPLKDYYKTGGIERCVWDIELYKDELYVGSGDYDKNKGPVNVWKYNFAEEEWKSNRALPDEQIERFFLFNDRLYIAGTDPQSSWSYGNYYYTDGVRWVTMNDLPNGIHNFDLVQFDGKIFAGMGVQEMSWPVAVSEDETNWDFVKFEKDGAELDFKGLEYIRVYDFFVLKDTLYAYLYLGSPAKTREIYRFDGEKFVCHSDIPMNIKYSRSSYNYFAQKTEFGGKQYFTTGHLYKTEDMKTTEIIEFGEKTTVNDIRVIDDVLYILCNEKAEDEEGNETFRVSVKRSSDGETFEEMFSFNYPVRALSFTYGNEHFYFGMGYGTKAKKEYEQNGMVLSVKNSL